MEFTDFKNFEEALKRMGASLGNVEIKPIEITIQQGVDLDNLITISNGGVYFIDLKNGLLTRITLNICDIDTYYPKKEFNEIEKIIANRNFEYPGLIKCLHKYHFTYCRTLKKFHDENKQDRYYGSSRWTGTFKYQFIKNNSILSENKDQKLYPCKNCLGNLSKKNGRAYKREGFNIKNALDMSNQLSQDYKLECEYIPNIYAHDWSEISTKMKKERDYACEKCKKKYPKNNLDCHHVNHLKNDNRIINLKVLCKRCHSSFHPHMEQ